MSAQQASSEQPMEGIGYRCGAPLTGQWMRVQANLKNAVKRAAVEVTGQHVYLVEAVGAPLNAIKQALSLESVQKNHEGRGCEHCKDPVDLTIQVQYRHALRAAGQGVVGLPIYEGRYLLVERQRLYSWNQSSFHDGSIAFGDILRYLQKALRSGGAS